MTLHGLFCWEEIFAPLIGKAEEVQAHYGIGKDFPQIPPNMVWAQVSYKLDNNADKVIGFAASPTG